MMEKILRYQLIKSMIRKKLWKTVQFLGFLFALSLISQSAMAATTHPTAAKKTSSEQSQNKSVALHKSKKKRYEVSKKHRTRHLAKKHFAPRVNRPNIQTA